MTQTEVEPDAEAQVETSEAQQVTMNQAQQVAPAEPDAPDPWERFGWLMGAIWLFFLAFPLMSAWTAPTAPGRTVAVSAIIAFAAVYLHGLVRIGRADEWPQVVRIGVMHLVVMVLLIGVAALGIGLDALGMVTFVVAFGMFSLPLRWALTLGVAGVAAALALPWLAGVLEQTWFFVPIVFMVGVATGVVRVLEQRGVEHREHQDQLKLAAERDRVARDVHDVLGHSLTVVTVKAELAERLVELDPERAKAELAEIQSLTRQALAEIRATVAGLRVTRLSDELESAGTALAGAGIAAELPPDPAVVDPRHRITLAWALRELVTNVVRHSRAERCVVQLGPDWLDVTDDGAGASGSIEGNGLRGLRERVAGAGGEVFVRPGPDGAGTTVEVRL